MWSKAIDLGLQLLKGFRQRPFVEVAEHGLVEAFVLALGWFGLPRAARDVSASPLVSQIAQLGHTMISLTALSEHGDRILGGLPGRDMGGNRVAGVVVDELEDHAAADSRRSATSASIPSAASAACEASRSARPREAAAVLSTKCARRRVGGARRSVDGRAHQRMTKCDGIGDRDQTSAFGFRGPGRQMSQPTTPTARPSTARGPGTAAARMPRPTSR